MVQRSISPSLVRAVLLSGEIIEAYTDDLPQPSFLMLYFINQRPIHVVAADDHKLKITHIITAYEPSVVEWGLDFQTRRPK